MAHVWEGAAPVKETRVRLAALCVFASAFAASCGDGGSARGPVASLAASTEAEGAFRPLRTRWHELPRDERGALGPELSRFRERFPSDPLARLADAMRATLALDAGDLDGAEALARSVVAGSAGSTRDLALVVRGGVARRRGEPERALEALLPLSHKLIDPDTRELHSEEVVVAAMDAGRYDLALELAAAWLRESEGHERTVGRVAVLVASMPPDALTGHLEGATRGGLPAERGLLEVVARLLAEVAAEEKNSALAKLLVERVAPLLGTTGDAVAKLAAGARTGRIIGPTVGLLLSMGSAESRRRSAESAAGLAHGLGLPGSNARLVSRDDGGELALVAEALAALGAEGAGVVVGGTDGASAEALALAAESARLPVVLLAEPFELKRSASSFVFVLGEGEARVAELLGEALRGAGADPVRVLSSPCELGPLAPFGPREGLVLSGPPPCVEELLTRRLVPAGRLAVGLDATGLVLPSGAWAATAGLLPSPRTASEAPPSYGAWILAHHRPPTYWEALGHDAALLAWSGVSGLATVATEKPDEVAARRAEAQRALAQAEGALWSTEARGFGGGRVMARTVGVVEVR
jgi:hypothetical protein